MVEVVIVGRAFAKAGIGARVEPLNKTEGLGDRPVVGGAIMVEEEAAQLPADGAAAAMVEDGRELDVLGKGWFAVTQQGLLEALRSRLGF
jgi:hypothetical protein